MRKHLLLLATVVILASTSPLLGQGTKPPTQVEVINTPTVTVSNSQLTVGISPTANTVKLDASSIAEPALTPYNHVGTALDCPGTNICISQGPAVPAGKRLRVTNITGFITNQSATSAFVYFSDPGAVDTLGIPFVAFPVALQNFGFFGNSLSFSHEVNFYLEAGQQPAVRLGAPAGQTINVGAVNIRVTITGYLVNVTP